MSAPTVGVAMIVRDEAATIEQCLASFWEHVDAIAILDTGSKDSTLKVAVRAHQRWKAERPDTKAPVLITSNNYQWCDDFASARAAADELLTGESIERAIPGGIDWRCWIDADDILHGAEHLRALAAQAPPDLAAYIAGYNYATDDRGQSICYLRRERLVRTGHGTWEGRVHEAQGIEGGRIQMVDSSVLEWRHRKAAHAGGRSNERNLRILRRWVKDEPHNPRVLMYLGTEELARGRAREAVKWLRRYLKLQTTWTEERAQVHRKLALAYTELGEHDKARATAFEAVHLMPAWPDSYLTLAESYYHQRDPQKAIHWALQVIEHGMPETLLIVNPRDYDVAPHVIAAAAYGALGDLDRAIGHGERALALQPGHHVIAAAFPDWLARRKRENTADTSLALAQVLIEHDEQLKALEVLRQVPHYATDHPRVVALRSELAERIDRLTDPAGAQIPEDGVPDEHVDLFAASLPRARFLADTLRERAGQPTGWQTIRTRLGEFRTRWGDSMHQFLTLEHYEPEIEQLIRDRVKPGMTVAVVGANIGYFTRLLADQVGPAGVVHAVEPDPTNAAMLRLNVPAAVVHELAALDTDGEVVLRQHPVNSGDNRVFAGGGLDQGIRVPGRRLDQVLPAGLDFVLVDAQGVDDQVLDGLGARRPPVAVVEHWPEGLSWRGVTETHVHAAYERMGYVASPMGDTSGGHWNLLLEAA